MNRKIIVKEIIGSNIALSMEKGKVLYTMLREALGLDLNIILDFADMKVASPFLNSSIGYLFKDFNSEEINRRIECINMSESTERTLFAVKRNAERYFSSQEEARYTDQLIEEIVKVV